MMLPPRPCSIITRAACLMPRNTLRVRTANVRSKSATLISVSGPKAPPTPALLNTTSRPPKSCDRGRDQRLDRGLVGHVGAHEAQPVGLADVVDELLAVVGVEVADDDAGPGVEEPQHGPPADAAGAARDDGDPIR